MPSPYPILHDVVTLGPTEIQVQQLASLEDLFLVRLAGIQQGFTTRAALSTRACPQAIVFIMAMTVLGSLGNFSAKKPKALAALPKKS